jgi:signal transduction histidine kinase
MKLTKKQEAEIQGMHDNTDKIKAENQKLKAAIEKNTLELESKNHELEIETALEKVRAIALSMKEPADMPDVCRVIAKGLKKLGVEEIRNVQTAIFYEDAGTYMNYEYYAKHDKTFITQTSYTNHKIHRAFANQMLKGKEGFIKTHIPKAKLPGWIAYQKTTNVFIDSNLKKASSLTYYWYSLGPVALGISTYKPLNEEDIKLFKRFRNVFELAYRRFLDIELAITQAKEARIETALERVRAVAMAMRKPEELAGIGEKLFTELKALEFTYLRNTEILINNDAKETVTSYYYSDYGITGNIEIDYKLNPTVQGWINDLKKADDAFAEVIIPENEMKAWRKYRKGIGYLPDPKLNKAKTVCYYSYSIGLGAISISSFKPVSADQIKILERFRNVFNLSYQRYIDISKAEEQAREAQIELALERVRARAMAMQHSSDLTDTSLLLFQQVQALGVPQFGSGFNIWDDDKKTITAWMVGGAGQYNPLPPFKISGSQDIFILIGEAAQRGESFLVVEQAGEELVTHYRYMNSIPLWKKIMEGITLPTSQVLHCAFFSQGFLLFVSPVPIPEAHDIFKRFAKVFEQTYTRFLDLQKAEAQAREAQIEAVLEKVRSRSLAMQKSEELKEVIQVVIEQFVHLNINVEHAGFIIDYKEKDDMHIWLADQHAVPAQLTIPYFDSPHWNSFNEAKQKGSVFFANHLCFEEKNKFYGELFKLFPALPEETKEYYFNCPGLAVSTVLLDNAGLYIENFDGIPYTDEQNRILMRFGKVFQQTYTRFLDLQKSEAQAREATIEVSLERVRSKAMAMHSSEDLSATNAVFYHELNALHITPRRCGIGLIDKETRLCELSTMSTTEQGNSIEIVGKLKLTDHPVLEGIYDNWLTHTEYHPVLKGNEIKQYYQLVKPQIAFPDFEHDAILYGYFFYFNEGGVYAWTDTEMKEEELNIYRRFTSVLSLTYKRYKDLQHSEEQTREAQIELSLERVRAKTMAMHNSHDVADSVLTLFDEITKLGIETMRCGIGIIQDTKQMELWNVKVNENGKADLVVGQMDMTMHPLLQGGFNGWKNKEKFFTYELKDGDLINYYTIINNHPHYPVKYDLSALPQRMIHSEFYFPEGTLYSFSAEEFSAEAKKIFSRFAAVFGQTYRRYLDLQKSEAQAKESQIQLALERVRARTMAMQRSDELAETASIVFKQLLDLGVRAEQMRTCAIVTLKADEPMGECWITKPDGEIIQQSFMVPYGEGSAYKPIYDAWKRGEKFFVVHLAGDALVNHLNQLKKFANIPTQQFQALPGLPVETYTHALFFSQGYLLIISNDPLSAYHDIFERFGVVFQQTYTRFLDLQKAEAQAREANIEASLEKIRSRTMAMHNSQDVGNTIVTMFDELVRLDIQTDRCGILIGDESDYMEVWTAKANANEEATLIIGKLDMMMHPLLTGASKAWKNKDSVYTYEMIGEDLKNYYRAINNSNFYPVQFDITSLAVKQIHTEFFFPDGAIFAFTPEPLAADAIKIFKRFSGVFALTYRRYLDLQKAEAQAKEAKIETALERVRAIAMSMMKSDELLTICEAVFKQLQTLGFDGMRASQIYIRNDSAGKFINYEYSDVTGADVVEVYYDSHANTRRIYDVIRNAGDALIHNEITKKELDEWKSYLYDTLKQPLEKGLDAATGLHYYLYSFGTGAFGICTFKSIDKEELEILKRFRNVFNLSYQRHTDISLAEAQAREAKIEAAMEKVRGRAMGMQKPGELVEVAQLLRLEMGMLGVEELETSSIYIHNEVSGITECWYAIQDIREGHKKLVADHMNLVLQETWVGREMLKFYNSGEKQTSILMQGDNRKEWINYCAEHSTLLQGYYGEVVPERIYHLVKFSNGYIGAASPANISAESWDLLKRATTVFSLAYTRFSDLQLAEAQTREAQIEAGLERVRSRTMAMQKSDELAETAAVLFKQLVGLGIEPNRLYIILMNENSDDLEAWVTDEDGSRVSNRFSANKTQNGSLNKMYEGWVGQKKSITIHMQGKELEEYLHYLSDKLHVPFKDGLMQTRRIQTIAYFSQGLIGIASPDEQPAETTILAERFAAVFNLTYTRFNDLQIAESQTRETKIEAALEKVRGRAMAMHNSNDLSSTASTVFTELRKLGINPIRCGVGLLNKETRKALLYSASSSIDEDNLSLIGWVLLSGHPIMEDIYGSWLKHEDYFPEQNGEQLKSYYESLLAGLPAVTVPEWQSGQKEYGHFLTVSVGCLYAWSDAPYNDAEVKILKRFANIIDLTFRRYIELQKTEAGAREAVKQAALDRVRADIASMRTVSDLDRITPLIWNELMVLGIPFVRCGVFIMDDQQQLIHTFLSTPDGKAVAAFHLPYDTAGNLAGMVQNWQKKKMYINHWDEKDFAGLADTLVEQGAIASREQYISSIPHEGIYLHFFPFLQGMLYVGNTSRLNDDEINLIQSVADAFSTAYARYEDFNKLEAAKQQVENTLVDLKQAQTQLVQSEKMASLGELTAGIAHEIQNPLNFVNNFSEVSKELLDEMKAALDKGDIAEAEEIAKDVIQNLEKINHHGKRADAIVKGMLQHSRSSSATKESTDINTLTEEYLRLCYHGLRAKDKSFNATIKTDFGKTLEKINVVPQDIGRVILNLLTNAFYATNERKKKAIEQYEPAVTVKTSSTSSLSGGRGVEIIVIDNGGGIPQNIVDKIFQPFFTTKPTGQGTGLGLSLSYDIIKVHGGEIKVETKQGEGTKFIIQLPTGILKD